MHTESVLRTMLVTGFMYSVGSSMIVGAETTDVSPLGAAENPDCRAVYAVSEVREQFDCPAGKVFNFCIKRNVVDPEGFLTGYIEFFGDPTKGPTSLDDSGYDSAVYYGTLRFTTEDGVLESQEVGIYSKKTGGEYGGIGHVTSGTGKFKGYSGTLISAGSGPGKQVTLGTLCRN